MWLDDFRRRTAWNAYANDRRYDAPADPWRLVRVDPGAVQRYAVVSLRWGLGRVRGGDWDRPENCDRLRDVYIYEGLTQRFEEGRDWEDTTYCEWAEEQFEERDSIRGCENIEEFLDDRCGLLDDVYEDMRTNGYRPNLGAVYDGPEDADYIHELEPMVLIGRDGEIVWSEGFHRLVLADLVGIDAIPVYVIRRHERWQRVRDRVSVVDGVPSDLSGYAGHPDLCDVCDSSAIRG